MREIIEGVLAWVQGLTDVQIVLIVLAVLLLWALFIAGISVIVSFFCFLWWTNTRNVYLHLRKRVTIGWEDLEIALNQRVQLCEEMLKTVTAVVEEDADLKELEELRKNAVTDANVGESICRNKKFTLALRAFYANIPERYPQLEQNEDFKAKRQEMAKLEKEIDVSRQFYNGVVKYYNTKLDSFPSKIVGQRMGDGFEEQPYFKFH